MVQSPVDAPGAMISAFRSAEPRLTRNSTPRRLAPRGQVVRGLAVLLLLGAVLQAAAQAPAPPEERAPWRVVLIRNWDSLYPVNVMREQAMRRTLVENASRQVEFYPEEIDPLRFPGGLEPRLVGLLQEKYSATPIDLVIASGLEPLEFAARHRDTIWPGAAIVFNGVIDGALQGWKRPPRTTGVTMILDIEGTLDLGLALVPTARKVYLVAGNSNFDRMYLDIAIKAVPRARKPLETHFIVGLSQEETASRVASVERDALVLYLTMLRDGRGQIAGPGSPNIARVAEASRAPVISAVHTQWGRGPVGGWSSRFDEHGEAAGRVARAVLEGRDPDLISVHAEPQPTCEVDWNGLQRWSIPERNVPPACAITNVPPSLLTTYFWPFVGLVAIILLQGALLWALAIQSARRRRVEEELRQRTAEMSQVARISMIGALTASIAHEINQPMGAILSNAEAARMMLDQGTLTEDKLRAILTDIRDEDLRASAVIRGLRALLSRGEWKPMALEVNAEVAGALRHVAFDAARRGVRLSPIFDGEVPAVMGDSTQLQQMVINLVVNAMDAVAAVPGTRSEVRVVTQACTGGAEISVADRGPGLAPQDAARLFETPFTTKRDGMGFGLAIVRTIVEMHGGRVWFEPNKPEGAIFRVWLPAIGA